MLKVNVNTQDKPLPKDRASEETIKENLREMNYSPGEDIMRKEKEIDAEPQQLEDGTATE